MSKGSGGTRSSSSKSPSSLALSAGASAAATTSMKVGGVSPELAKARSFMKEEMGYTDTPVKNISFNEKTKTLTLEVGKVSEYSVNYKTGPVTYTNGTAGTTKVFDSSVKNGLKGADMSAKAIASKVGSKYHDAGLTPERVIIKEIYVSPEKWSSVKASYIKKRKAK